MKTEKIIPREEYIKLEQAIKLVFAISGGEAKERIQGGEVSVNGTPVLMRGKKLFPGDKVIFADTEIRIEK